MELCPILGRDLHTLPKDYALIQGGNWLMCLLSRLSLESRFAPDGMSNFANEARACLVLG